MRILLVEDHPALREVVASHLASRGFVVDAFSSGRDALAAVSVASYDAIILDLGLPDIEGMDLLARIRERTRHQVPALIATARDGLSDRVGGLNAGADDYLVKPFDLVELEARLRAILRRPGARANDLGQCGRLRVDYNARAAAVDGLPLDLQRREFALLEQLLRSNGNLVVRDVLEDRIYGLDDPVTPNALEALISRLRKKLENSQCGARIETRRGIGYRLVPEEQA
jgi:DNA-binding response OmpR family regulator